ncbi:hypothetical protein M408DRAFT_325419 [Serendipita vermifera MAFF 305830]|uniref:Uncharacterized protein n=1 Tax=Serendipita vermifera MAFF 305830 TaxID=933852 RepID=A0A0C3BP11_SERVB|nr:hypothetical protein M408DRAFT_18827 [Serendipita vermifera MAFF 305830]KIM33834.1 hypothetical protein M408DRAFT_325419 [Serendipita vermifera MAFF 305830]
MSSITAQRMALLKDQECTYANARMAAIANALTHKYALVRTHESLALIHILSADCLLNPGAKRLTAFDIHISAVVYGATARPGQFSISHTYRSFIAYDLVALFSSPSTFPAGSSPQIITPPAHWLAALKTLETRAAEPGRGGIEALLSIFADDTAINALVRASIAMSPTVSQAPSTTAVFQGCAPRKSSFALVNDRRMSAH